VQERHVAVRVIAATNQMLEQRVQEGRFRADLLYRLRVIHFQVPPLRSRGADIQLLATRFIEQFGRRYGKPQLAFTPAALEALGTHTWPGNVRELRNFIEQAVLLAQHDRIDVDDLSLPRTLAPMEPALLADAPDGIELASVEHGLIRRALERSEWNITQAARLLGISRDTLRYRMERHRISREA
jgi:two-component system, NtrC family, response regulator AtoC